MQQVELIYTVTHPDGREGPVTRRPLRVVPPWWRSAGAGVAYGVLGLAAVWMGLRWRLSAVERRAARLEALVDQRTVQLVEAREEAEAALMRWARAEGIIADGG